MIKADKNFISRIKRLLKEFDLEPKDVNLYICAFTHPSAASKQSESYELLEFLGDSIVLVHVVNCLVRKYPDGRVGLLSKAKSQIVSGESLAKIAFALKLDKIFRMDDSILKNHYHISNNVMADVFEAFVGAIYLDLGMRKVKRFLTKVLKENIEIDLQKRKLEDFKSILQEDFQKLYKCIPMYKLVKTKGPDHDKVFYVQVIFRNTNMGKGKGRCKKEAEQEAARETLKKKSYYFKLIEKSENEK